MSKKKGRKGGGCKLTALVVLLSITLIPVVFAADAVMKKENQEIVNAEANPVAVKPEQVLVSVDLDSKIKTLTKQREDLAAAGQKNLGQRQEIESKFAAVTGALITLQELKKESEDKGLKQK